MRKKKKKFSQRAANQIFHFFPIFSFNFFLPANNSRTNSLILFDVNELHSQTLKAHPATEKECTETILISQRRGAVSAVLPLT